MQLYNEQIKVGGRNGSLVVVKTERLNTGKCKTYWVTYVKCDCGHEQKIPSHLWIRHPEKYLLCRKCKIRGKNNYLWNGHEEISGDIFYKIKHGADIRDIPFNLTKEFLWKLFLKQDRKCALSGMKIALKVLRRDKSTASLDRIDSNKGYTEDNVQWIHKDVNLMKNAFAQDYFISVCKLVSGLG